MQAFKPIEYSPIRTGEWATVKHLADISLSDQEKAKELAERLKDFYEQQAANPLALIKKETAEARAIHLRLIELGFAVKVITQLLISPHGNYRIKAEVQLFTEQYQQTKPH